MLSEKDILDRKFNRTMRGYDPVEVRYFLEMMNQEYQQLVKRIMELEKLERGFEEIGEKNPLDIIEEANEKGRQIIADAQDLAAEVIRKTNQQKEHIADNISLLISEREKIRHQLEIMIARQQDLLDVVSEPEEKFDAGDPK